jgi:ectoine hydroxylase-related dioxygenase (phytanoyl-CoA dioxygenase family)
VYLDEVFQRLVINPKIMRAVLALTGSRPQLLAASYTKNYQYNDEISFHNGHDGGLHNPANQYQANGYKVFATFLNAAVSLVDVPPGAGGFVCVPGSHKSNFACPDSVSIYDEEPVVHNVSVRAGDCVLFTELLRHGGRRWTLDEPRRTIIVRYCTTYASWSPGVGPIAEYRHLLSDEVAELMSMLGHQACKKVVQRLLDEMEAGTA